MSAPPSLPPKGHSQTVPDSGPQQQQQQQQQRPRIPLPQSFNVLPTREITKLLDNLDVLKGYLITLMEEQMEKDVQEIDSVVRQIEEYVQRLKELEAQKTETNTRLARLQQLTLQWQQKEAEMNRSLQKFSRENIYSLLQNTVQESRRLTDSIQDSFLSHTGQHDEAAIQTFVRSYKQDRTVYYLRKEKLDRFNENRVGGLS